MKLNNYITLNGFRIYADLMRYFGWTPYQISKLTFLEIRDIWIILGIDPLKRYLEAVK